MTTSIDDEEDSGGKPGLEEMIQASLIDDLGANSVFLDCIVDIYRSWHNRRDNNSAMGLSQNSSPVPMVSQKT